jgi:hypothetical protein
MSAVPDPPVLDEASPRLRRPPRRLLVAGIVVAVAVVAAVVLVVVSRGSGDEVGVVEVGFSEVRRAEPVFGDDPVREGPPVVSWAAVVENASDDRAARGTSVSVELVDDDGHVIAEYTRTVGLVPPDGRMALTGTTDEHVSAIEDIRAEVERTEEWQPADRAPVIEVGDLDVAYSSANQPIVRYTAEARAETVRDRLVHIVARDHDGDIVAGGTDREDHRVDPPLEPGEPVPGDGTTFLNIPDLATIEVYLEPTDPP